jgi:hypothetical protein
LPSVAAGAEEATASTPTNIALTKTTARQHCRAQRRRLSTRSSLFGFARRLDTSDARTSDHQSERPIYQKHGESNSSFRAAASAERDLRFAPRPGKVQFMLDSCDAPGQCRQVVKGDVVVSHLLATNSPGAPSIHIQRPA